MDRVHKGPGPKARRWRRMDMSIEPSEQSASSQGPRKGEEIGGNCKERCEEKKKTINTSSKAKIVVFQIENYIT